MSNWISVKDNMPPTGEWYLISSDMNLPYERIVTMAFLDDDVNGGSLWLPCGDSGRLSGDCCEWENVTHWMQLPEAPNEQ